MTDSAPLLDYIAAAQARDAGMKLAADNSGEFMTRALAVIASMRGEVQGEHIRAECIARGIIPKSSAAWGALIRTAAKRGLLENTGIYRATESVKTHCHPTVVWRIAA